MLVQVWPACLVAGLTFAIPQFLVSNFHGPWIVDIVASVTSMVCLTGFLRIWRRTEGTTPKVSPPRKASTGPSPFLPWIILTVLVFLWGLPNVKAVLDHLSAPRLAIPGLDKVVQRVAPVVTHPTAEPAVFTFNWLSATGTAILIASIITGVALRYRPGELLRHYGRTLYLVRHSLLTIAAMLALGYTTRYSGEDAILGPAFAHAGVLYPFFGTLLGWLGVALTGSDTASNVLFGSLQRVTAERLGLSPTLMAAANSSGGVMGKMIDAQSIVVASTATRWYGQEWRILRYVFFHSLALASLVGLLVLLQQYVFTWMIVR